MKWIVMSKIGKNSYFGVSVYLSNDTPTVTPVIAKGRPKNEDK